MNHAFLMMVHDEPELALRIVNRLIAPNHFIFMHIDRKISKEHFNFSLKGLTILPNDSRVRVSWGGFSQVEAEFQLMKSALTCGIDMDYFHLISGHDYPIVSNNLLDDFFEKNNGKSFLYYDKEDEALLWRKKKYPGRVCRYHLNDINIKPLLLKRILSKMLSIKKRPYIENLFAGWQWWSFNKTVITWLSSHHQDYSAMAKRFRFTACSDELFFQTILHPFVKQLNIETTTSLRYIDWHPKRPTKSLPLILDARDYEEIIQSGMLFCRKVTLSKSIELLNKLDDYARS
ncbi:hypothetical protein IKQ19_10000 [Candidatus Saccharibacteria bacterium]|nr:hypothetical protein [Candidatus Saccharibacteria bacterium]